MKNFLIFLSIFLFFSNNVYSCETQEDCIESFNLESNLENFEQLENPSLEQFNQLSVEDKNFFMRENYLKQPEMFESFLREDLGFSNLGSISGSIKSFNGDTIEGQNGIRVSSFIEKDKDLKFNIVDGNIVFGEETSFDFSSGGGIVSMDSDGNPILYLDKDSELEISSSLSDIPLEINFNEGSKIIVPKGTLVKIKSDLVVDFFVYSKSGPTEVFFKEKLTNIESFLNSKSMSNRVEIDLENNVLLRGTRTVVHRKENAAIRSFAIGKELGKVGIIDENVYIKGNDVLYGIDEYNELLNTNLFEDGSYFFIKTDSEGNLIKSDPRNYRGKFQYAGIRDTINHVRERNIDKHQIRIGNVFELSIKNSFNNYIGVIDLEDGTRLDLNYDQKTGKLDFSGKIIEGVHTIPKELLKFTVIPQVLVEILTNRIITSNNIDFSGRLAIGDKSSNYEVVKVENVEISPNGKVIIESEHKKTQTELSKIKIDLVREEGNKITYLVDVPEEESILKWEEEGIITTAEAKITLPRGKNEITIEENNGEYYIVGEKTIIKGEGDLRKLLPIPIVGDALGVIVNFFTKTVFGIGAQIDVKSVAWMRDRLCVNPKSKLCEEEKKFMEVEQGDSK